MSSDGSDVKRSSHTKGQHGGVPETSQHLYRKGGGGMDPGTPLQVPVSRGDGEVASERARMADGDKPASKDAFPKR